MKTYTLFITISIQIVCCYKGIHSSDRLLHEDKSSSLLPKFPECGRLPKEKVAVRIFKGSDAMEGQVPWIVKVETVTPVKENPNGTTEFKANVCGGSIINDRYVLTAAHCCQSEELGSWSWVRAGRNDFNIRFDNFSIEVEESIKNPKYIVDFAADGKNVNYVQYDICLLRLKDKFQFTDLVLPICLPSENEELNPGEYLYAAGWGYTEEDDETLATQLQIARLEVKPRDHCDMPLRHNVICAGGTSEVDTKNILQGDSGGPLYKKTYVKGKSSYYLYGVTSTIQNLTSPSLFEKVQSYMSWITEVIKP